MALKTNAKDGHPMHMRMSVIKGFRSSEIEQWAKKHLKAPSIVIADGLACFTAVSKAGGRHFPVVMGGRFELLDHKAFKRPLHNTDATING